MKLLILDSTTKSIKAKLKSNVASLQPSSISAWADSGTNSFIEGSTEVALNNTAYVTVVAAPADATRRVIKGISIHNSDSAPVEIELVYDSNGTIFKISTITLLPDASWTLEGIEVTNGSIEAIIANTWIETESDPVFSAWLAATPPAFPGDIPTALSELSEDETHRTVTDTEKDNWSGKENAGVAATLDEAVLSEAKTYAEGLVVGLWDDRGTFDASVNTFPTTGGSGTDGAILKGDIWTISVIATAGALLGYPVGTTVRALVDTPEQVAGNWAVSGSGLGYTPENAANKVTEISETSTDVQYPSAKVVYEKLASKQSKLGWFNILDYGAGTAKTAAENTTAINAAITAAAAVKGTVFIPLGTYLVNTISYNPAANIQGDKTDGSILRSASAVPLLSYTGSFIEAFTYIRDLTLDGNNVGTIGLELYLTAYFNFENVKFIYFTSHCVKFYGSLVGKFENCWLRWSANGISAVKYSTYQPNLVTFNFCRLSSITGEAINWSDGAQLILNNCDLEDDGSANDATKGAIHLRNMSPSSEGVAFIMEGCWTEGNHNTFIKIDNSLGISTSIISNTIIQYNTLTAPNGTYGVYLTGNNAYKNTLIIKESTITSNVTKDVVADGANAAILHQNCTFGTTQALNSGIIVEEKNETTTTIGALINSATAKATPVDADQIGLMDSAAYNVLKKLSWSALKSTLKTYFDTLYSAGGIPDAPSDSKTYGRSNAAWVEVIGGSGGSSFWTAVGGTPTRASNTTFTVTGDSTALFAKGLILKWTESAAVKVAMVSIPSTYSSPNTTVTIIGDTMASIDANSLKYCLIGVEAFAARFGTAGNIGAVATDIANVFYATEPFRVLGADLQVGTAGTTNSTTIDINKNGTTMFTTKPTLATTVAKSATPFTADSGTSLALGDRVSIDIDAVQTTNAVDLYVQLYLFPTRYLNL